eukprot:1158139-Pelagomonas_calceolata.AAC.2
MACMNSGELCRTSLLFTVFPCTVFASMCSFYPGAIRQCIVGDVHSGYTLRYSWLEMRMLDKLNERPDLADRLKAVAKQLNLVEEEAYDLVLMRNEYKTLMGLHTGRVPGELAEIFEELKAQ